MVVSRSGAQPTNEMPTTTTVTSAPQSRGLPISVLPVAAAVTARDESMSTLVAAILERNWHFFALWALVDGLGHGQVGVGWSLVRHVATGGEAQCGGIDGNGLDAARE